MSGDAPSRTICWVPTWSTNHAGIGIEHLILAPGQADSKIVAIDDDGTPFRLAYRLAWDDAWRLSSARLDLKMAGRQTSLILRTDGQGHWQDGEGAPLGQLEGCLDLDIWPTPFTNSFPIRRAPLAIGERREIRVAWINGLGPDVQARRQAYSRLSERGYLFETLDGPAFQAGFEVDADGVVLDYAGLFQRVDVDP